MNNLLLSIIIISLVGILMIPNAFAVKTVIVQNAAGSSNPGCEETNLCFDPNPVIINVQDKITWENNDSASHTVTSGNPTTGPLEYFDSGLMMPGDSYSLVFPGAGTYDYFCMVHPWMEGKVVVGGGTSSSSSASKVSTMVTLDLQSSILEKEMEMGPDGLFEGKINSAIVTVSGQLHSTDHYITDAPIKLVFIVLPDGQAWTKKWIGNLWFNEKDHYEVITDDEGKFNERIFVRNGVMSLVENTNSWSPRYIPDEYLHRLDSWKNFCH